MDAESLAAVAADANCSAAADANCSAAAVQVPADVMVDAVAVAETPVT